MDLSDGLALDASRLAAASGRGAVIDVDGLPISEAARELDDPLAHALGDGEDFELLLAVAPDVAKQLVAEQPVECGLTDVGELTAEPGLRQRDAQGKTTTLEPAGWLHGQHNV
jgi:thiamine-monophosphate kinase